MNRRLAETAAGLGIYEVRQASRLTGVPAATMNRFLWGYRSGSRQYPPVFRGDYADASGGRAVSFLDMTEVKLLRLLRERGLSLQTLRRAARRAAEILKSGHPFSSRRIKALGTSIFAEIGHATGESRLIEVLSDQLALRTILGPFLEDLDYGEDDNACRWWPLGRDHPVVIDPGRSLGRPIVHGSGVPTRILADAVASNGSIETAAAWFDVEAAEVRAALDFEERVLGQTTAA